jgi:nitric-oxide synthase
MVEHMSKLHQSGGLSVFARQNSMAVLKEETRAWHRLYCAENSWPEISARRWLQIEDELERTGTYWQSAEELEYGAKVAWRNSTRCIGRLHWQNLLVRDCRALRSAEEISSAGEHNSDSQE